MVKLFYQNLKNTLIKLKQFCKMFQIFKFNQIFNHFISSTIMNNLNIINPKYF